MRYLDKSDDFESFLSALNDAAGGLPPPVLRGPVPGSAQVVGLPRSGTTLLFQLLAHTGEVGYPSNVMAFFHRAPWVGARLQEQLAATDPTLTYESVGGRTREPLDPHELGYFWRRVCGHTSNSLVGDAAPLPLDELQRELDLVAAVFGRPVVYKNFLAITHAARMRRLDRMSFVVVRRDLLEVATSLLGLRRRLGTPDDQPLGVQPTTPLPRDTDVVRSVARQVVHLERDLADAALGPAPDVEVVDYRELCRDPRATVERVLVMMGAATGGVARLPEALPVAAARHDDVTTRLQRALDDAREEP